MEILRTRMTNSILSLKNQSLVGLQKWHGIKGHSQAYWVLEAMFLPPTRLPFDLVFHDAFTCILSLYSPHSPVCQICFMSVHFTNTENRHIKEGDDLLKVPWWNRGPNSCLLTCNLLLFLLLHRWLPTCSWGWWGGCVLMRGWEGMVEKMTF